MALAAVLVVAAIDGGAGVRDLARRSLRWRVGVRWYLLAVLGLPVVVLVGAIALFGTAALAVLADDWPLLFTRVLPVLLLQLVLFQLAEEVGWMGFLQARLQDRHGPLKASLLVTVPFALWHLPDLFAQFGLATALIFLPIQAAAPPVRPGRVHVAVQRHRRLPGRRGTRRGHQRTAGLREERTVSMYVTLFGDRRGTLPAGWANETVVALLGDARSTPPEQCPRGPG